jgi:hypothetical protein
VQVAACLKNQNWSYAASSHILHVTSMSLLLGDLIGLIRRHMPISLPLLPSIMQLYFGWGLRGPLRVIIMVMLGDFVFNSPVASIMICANTKVHFGRKYGTHGTKRTVGTHGRTHGWSKNAR